MKKVIAIFALAFVVMSCGSSSSNEATTDSTAVAADSSAAVTTDSAAVAADTTAVK